jgi:flavin-dependent dehydrogenase
MQEVDLLIIGAGPSGLSTAMHLLQRDASWQDRMILIEKSTHPRPKLCGGGMTHIGLETLHDLGIELPLPIPGVVVEEARLLYRGRTIHVRGRPEFVVYNRIELDNFLAQQARQRGIVINENEAVQDVTVNSSGVDVKTSRDTYLAKAVVGADGSKGASRKLIPQPGSKTRVARALETVYPAQETQMNFVERFATLDFNPVKQDLQGYFWDFPSLVAGQPRFNRGVYDSRFVPGRQETKLPAILEAGIADLGDDPQWDDFQGHPIHWFSPLSRFSIPRLLLVGDAAGVDSLLGEGIGPAMAYGKVAAEILDKAFEREEFTFKDYKRHLLTSPVGKYLLYRWCVAWWGYRLSWSSAFMHVLWTVVQVAVALWPKEAPLYPIMDREPVRKSGDQVRDYAD